MIKNATIEDVKNIEIILRDAVEWMNTRGIPNLWTLENTNWSCLNKSYKISDFYLIIVENQPAGCVAPTKIDKKFWADAGYGDAVYIHKLAVKREFSGREIGKELIEHAKMYALSQKINYVRLDCNYNCKKIRDMYEKQGFKYIGMIEEGRNYKMALYQLEILQ